MSHPRPSTRACILYSRPRPGAWCLRLTETICDDPSFFATIQDGNRSMHAENVVTSSNTLFVVSFSRICLVVLVVPVVAELSFYGYRISLHFFRELE